MSYNKKTFLITATEQDLLSMTDEEITNEVIMHYEDQHWGVKWNRQTENERVELDHRTIHSGILYAEGKRLSVTHPALGRKLMLASAFWNEQRGLECFTDEDKGRLVEHLARIRRMEPHPWRNSDIRYERNHLETLRLQQEYQTTEKTEPKRKSMIAEIQNNGKKGFACVAGMKELKAQLEKEVLFPLRNKELMQKYRVHPLNGMLLYGYPGCGKTFIAEKFAEESGMQFEKHSSGSISGKYCHETANNIKDMFERARKKAPCVLCIDEIDSLCPQRSTESDSGAMEWNESVDEFLTQMNNCSHDEVFVIGTTNNPTAIDQALLRTGRMDKIIYVPMPDEECRKEMLTMYLADRPQEEGIDITELANLTNGMTASDIDFMVNSVAIDAAYKGVDITYNMLAEQAKSQRRSVVTASNLAKSEEKVVPQAKIPKVIGFSQVG